MPQLDWRVWWRWYIRLVSKCWQLPNISM